MSLSERVFCVDFGSTFTKIALRASPGASSTLLETDAGIGDENAVCIPTLVFGDWTGKEPTFACGKAAAGTPPGPRQRLYKDWKKYIFLTPPPAPAKAVTKPAEGGRIDALLKSAEFAALATRYEVTGGQIDALQRMVAAASGLTALPAVATTPPPPTNPAPFIAVKFFAYLREVALNLCRRQNIPDPETIPVRVTVPALPTDRSPNASELLKKLFRQAGWTVHPDRGVLSEPFANAIGALTRGANVLQASGRIHMGRMFRDGPLMTALKDPAHHPAYRAVVVDVGGFTTDFAAATLDTEGRAVDDPAQAIRVADLSVATAVGDIDKAVVAALPKDKGDWLDKHATPEEWEAFRVKVYTEGGAYGSDAVGPIGGSGEMPAIRDAMAGVTQRLGSHLREFCIALPPLGFQELVLTGGGCCIPAVRDALLSAAQPDGVTYRRYNLPGRKKIGTVHLDDRVARGGTALGGASIFFEQAYY